MPLSGNLFTTLSYISGPALLTNATSVLLLGTTNRLARVVDRSRQVVALLNRGGDSVEMTFARREFIVLQRRLRLVNRAITGLYLAIGAFAISTALSIVGAAAAEAEAASVLAVPLAAAFIIGTVGFGGFVAGSVLMLLESRLAIQALTHESAATMARLRETPLPVD